MAAITARRSGWSAGDTLPRGALHEWVSRAGSCRAGLLCAVAAKCGHQFGEVIGDPGSFSVQIRCCRCSAANASSAVWQPTLAASVRLCSSSARKAFVIGLILR